MAEEVKKESEGTTPSWQELIDAETSLETAKKRVQENRELITHLNRSIPSLKEKVLQRFLDEKKSRTFRMGDDFVVMRRIDRKSGPVLEWELLEPED